MPPIPYVVDTSHSPHARLRPVAIDAVHLNDDFIEPRRKTNRLVTIPSQFDHLETTNRLRNFRRVIDNTPEIPFDGIYFNDSDVYKWLEAAASALADPALENRTQIETQIGTAIELIEKAQSPDGYLNTYYSFEREGERYTNLRDMHELYCMGHFVQAAVAHYRATGSEHLLSVARRVADHLDDTFGPADSGKREGTCGHEEIELALVELYRATREGKYLLLAEYFVNARGQEPSAAYRTNHSGHHDRRYMQDHVPYRQLQEVTGHAVRMLYLATGATDVALETGEHVLSDAIHAQWKNMVERRSYISGGVGSRWEGEAFGKDYELPADRAYTETCAAIASVMWNYRLLLSTGESKYADLMEHTLYNAVLPGLSLSGDEYFYQNPLENDGTHRRQKWFGCACCPPNVARLLAQLPGYVYATDDNGGVFINLYAQGTAMIELPNAGRIKLTLDSSYPWDGIILIRIAEATGPFPLHLRIPEWAKGATIAANGQEVAAEPGTFAPVSISGAIGQQLHLRLPMPVRSVVAHPFVNDASARMAYFRGPLLYCAEANDNRGDVREIGVDLTPRLLPCHLPDLPGITALKGVAWNIDTDGSALYRPATDDYGGYPDAAPDITLIPYYAWANREPGVMRVWLRRV
ncbi:MAG: glycoside hydrolase family 127 protein [Fibrella sp.]|nr:glycoside hydrolase family 127 protein [Armatimonadota bacterium]